MMEELKSLALEISLDYKIDYPLFYSIITVESGWNPKVMRYELSYRWTVRPPDFASALGITYDTEVQMQKFSYGLCQIMGGKARDLGYGGFLADLLTPRINLELGAKIISQLSSKYGYEPDVISSYNQGTPRKTPGGLFENQQYVDKVDKVLREMRKLV